MQIKKIVYLLCSYLLICGFNSFNTWQEIDNQEAPYLHYIYKGEYTKAYSQVKALAENGDTNAQYTLAQMYDFAEHKVACSGYRNCYPDSYKPVDSFEFSKSEAKKWYKQAAKNGHPYASYMLARHVEYDGKNLTERDDETKLAIKDLTPRFRANDGVATFMYYKLTSYTFGITPQTTNKSNLESERNLHLIIKLLEEEAKQGRVLAMHYLGKAYFQLWDYPKSFAWFTVATKHNHNPSGVYQKMVMSFIEKKGLEKETLTELNLLLSKYPE